ncbi:MAG: hypothetical protein O6499_00150 [Candidatus Dadabacteria bacterium]|nr:hypothetical protein [Candidatus Dadabacteria bacterium]
MSEKNMRIMRSIRDNTKNCPASIPFSLLSEEQAQRNHSQTLTRLNERGGLSPNEALWNIERRDWGSQTLTEQNAIDTLNVMIKRHEDANKVDRIKELETALNNLLNDCINFDDGNLTKVFQEEASKALGFKGLDKDQKK